jgi:glycerate kinase
VLDTRGEPVRPGGAGLRDVATLDLTGLHPALYPAGHAADIILAADVGNPLTGPDGAAEVYGPQKGASPAEVDAQSLAGKTPVGVARAAARHGIGVVAVAGRSTLSEAELAAAGIAAVYALSDLEPDLERCRAEAARLLRRTGQMIARDRLAEVVTGA